MHGLRIHWFLAILLLAAGLRAVAFGPMLLLDDAHYAEAALRLAVAGEVTPSHFGVRVGLVAPIALLVKVFGMSVWTLVAVPFFASLTTVWVAALVGHAIGGPRVGTVCAALVAVFPLEVIFASHAFPCTVQACSCGLCVLASLRAAPTDRRSLVWLAGVALGVGYLARATAVFCVVPCLVALHVAFPKGTDASRSARLWLARTLVFVAGFATVLVVESVVFWAFAGEPLLRWRVLSSAIAVQGGSDVVGAWTDLGWWLEPWLRLLSEQELGVYPLLTAVAGVQAWRRGSPRLRVLVVWVAFVALYTFYGTVSPLRLAPLPRLPRYLALVTVPAIALLGWYLCSLRRSWQLALGGLVGVTSVAGVALDSGRLVFAHHRDLHRDLEARSEPVYLTTGLVFGSILTRGCDVPRSVWIRPGDTPTGAWRRLLDLCPAIEPVESLPAPSVAGETVLVASSQSPTSPQRERATFDPRVGTATVVAIHPAHTGPYYDLLRQPAFRGALSWTRDPLRAAALAEVPNRTNERLVVVRIQR